MRLNHPERGSKYPTHLVPPVKNYTHLVFSVANWFEKVRGGSMRLNHPELVSKYPTHLVPPVQMKLGKVRYSRTTPNPCERTLVFSAMKWFEKVRGGSMQ